SASPATKHPMQLFAFELSVLQLAHVNLRPAIHPCLFPLKKLGRCLATQPDLQIAHHQDGSKFFSVASVVKHQTLSPQFDPQESPLLCRFRVADSRPDFWPRKRRAHS